MIPVTLAIDPALLLAGPTGPVGPQGIPGPQGPAGVGANFPRLLGAYTSIRGSERYANLTVLDYPRQVPAPERVCVLECRVPDVKAGDIIMAWGSIQCSNRLTYAVELCGHMRLETGTGGVTGTSFGPERGYNVVPQLFDFPGGYAGPETFPGMHHGPLSTHGFVIAPTDAALRYVSFVAYAGGSSATLVGDNLRVDAGQGQIDVLHFGTRA